MMKHTPPAHVGSLEPKAFKRVRSGSIVGRLRSASELFDDGLINAQQSGVLKDLIIAEDPKLGQILQRIDQGDKSAVVSLRESGVLDRRQSIDILADMGDSFDFLGVGAPQSPSAHARAMRSRANSMALARGGGGGSTNGGGTGSMKEALFVMDDDDEGAEMPDYQLGDDNSMFSLSNIRPLPVKSEPGLHKNSVLSETGGIGEGVGGYDAALPEMFEFGLFDDQDPSGISASSVPRLSSHLANQFSGIDSDDEFGSRARGSAGTPTSQQHRNARIRSALRTSTGSMGSMKGPKPMHIETHHTNPGHQGKMSPARLAAMGLTTMTTMNNGTNRRVHRDSFCIVDDMDDVMNTRGMYDGDVVFGDDEDDDAVIAAEAAMVKGLGLQNKSGSLFTRSGVGMTRGNSQRSLIGGEHYTGSRSSTSQPIGIPGNTTTNSGFPPPLRIRMPDGVHLKKEFGTPTPTSTTTTKSTKTKKANRGAKGGVKTNATSRNSSRGGAAAANESTSRGRGRGRGSHTGSSKTKSNGATVKKEEGSSAAAARRARELADMDPVAAVVAMRGGTGENLIGAYSPESRKKLIARFIEKRHNRIWKKTVKYDVRKNFADSRLRVKGRFVKKENEDMLRDLMLMT